jgi:hypothetical protein
MYVLKTKTQITTVKHETIFQIKCLLNKFSGL